MSQQVLHNESNILLEHPVVRWASFQERTDRVLDNHFPLESLLLSEVVIFGYLSHVTDGRFLALRPGPWTSVGLRFPNMRHKQPGFGRDLWHRTVDTRKVGEAKNSITSMLLSSLGGVLLAYERFLILFL